jgi:hypothetical protein
MVLGMKKFAIFLPNTEQAQIIEGISAVVTRKADGLKVVINLGNKKKVTVNGVIIFTEVSESVRVM